MRCLRRLRTLKVEVLFDTILSNTKGKIVYIDFWSTWCVPCIKGFPDVKELRESYAELGLEVVSACLDANKKKWEKISDREGLFLKNYLCKQGEGEEIMNLFSIRMIPNYMLMSKKGEFVDWGHHLSPSNPLTKKRIPELLNEE